MRKVFLFAGEWNVKDMNVETFERLKKKFQDKGYSVCSPNDIEENRNSVLGIEDLNKNEIRELLRSCDVIAILDNWTEAKSTMVQLMVAQETGIKIIYAETEKEFDFELEIKANRKTNKDSG